MASSHGKSGVFKLDNSAGALQDLSSNISRVNCSFIIELADDTALGDAARSRIAGLRDHTISVEGQWDPASNLADAVFGGTLGQANSLTFQYFPAGTGSGAVVYYGECRTASYDIEVPVDDIVSFTAELQTTGNVTRSTV